MENYETFASVYDAIMDESLYDKWTDFSLRHFPKGKKTLLELACGTGIQSVRFAQEGFTVTGLDISEDMLGLAYNRALDQEVEVQFIEGDMLDLSGIGSYDLVTCYSDSLCYMTDLSTVGQVFEQVYRQLRADGVFIFDVHSLYQIDAVFPQQSYHENADDFAFLWDSFSGEEVHSIVHELTFFVRNQEGDFTRLDEIHHERTYAIGDYKEKLQQAGFDKIEVYADFTDHYPDDKSKRWFFVAHKGAAQ